MVNKADEVPALLMEVPVWSIVWAVLPQDVFTDEPAVVAMGAGDEEQNLASIFHAAQPSLDRVGTTLQVLAWIPLHTWEVCPCIICGETQQ